MREWRMAWRNLWRNRKRTLITAAAVAMAVLLSTIMSSMQEGTYSKMIDNVVKFYSGYIQIQHPDYWDTRSLNDSYAPDDSLYETIGQIDGITLHIPRIESFTLISSGEITKGCALIGIDPEGEDRTTNLSNWVDRGEYLKQGDDGILLATNLAKNLNVSTGDTLVLLSQGYHGASAAALVPIKGILDFPSPQMNSFGAYITLEKAGEFYGMDNNITSMVLMLNDYMEVERVKNKLASMLGASYEIMSWDEMQPDLVNMIRGDRAGAIVMKGILYLVVGFGILGTIIMMMSERKKEMGVMVAIGMKKIRMQKMLVFETISVGLLGVLIGFAISLPVILVMVHNPIPLTGELAEAYEMFGIEPNMYFSMMPKVFVNQMITVFVIALVIAAYPIFQIINMNALKAIRN
ncbi:MAG: ABC transporter permease [Bacteroidales bacterium]|nr:ABC transporter permease [Bacteroidales bacterium]